LALRTSDGLGFLAEHHRIRRLDEIFNRSRLPPDSGVVHQHVNSTVPFDNRSNASICRCIVGGLIGGWSLYTRGGRPKYCYNFFGIERFVIEGSDAMSAGTHQVRMEFVYDGGEIAKGGDVTLFVDGDQVGAGRVEQTEPFLLSADETCDIGFEAGSPVIVDYEADKGRFNGEVKWVQIDVGDAAEDPDHYITEEERYRVAIAIQ
jgi:hypothetical protein